MLGRYAVGGAGRMRWRDTARSCYCSWHPATWRNDSSRGRSRLSRHAWRVKGCPCRLQGDSIAYRFGYRRQRRTARHIASSDRTLLCRLPDAKPAGQDPRFASRYIAVKSATMPLYMDIHELGEVTPEDVAKAHVADLEAQEKYGVNYLKYWVNENRGKVFCLVEAPNAEAANSCHREAHGLVARKIIEIQPELADGFLGDVQTNAAGAAVLPGGGADARDPGIRTVLFTDIVNSTTFTQSLGDQAALELFGVHDTIARDALSALGGREVKHTGDGIMASFVSAAGAVRCAIQIQRELAKHEKAQPDRSLKVRVGAAAGEPVEQHNDLFGSTVQLAARLCAHAQPEQILVTNAVAELCIGKGLLFEDLGEVVLKGFGRPVRAHAVQWTGEALQTAV